MKNRIQFLAMATCCMAAALFSGCEKDQQHKGLKVSIEGVSSNDKVHLESLYPTFYRGDEIKVNEVLYKTDEYGKECLFLSSNEIDEAVAPYYLIFPANSVTGTVGKQPSVILPETQPYELENGQQRLLAPMGGAKDVGEISIRNFCSVLNVAIKNSGSTSVKISSIEVSSSSICLSYPAGLQLNAEMMAFEPEVDLEDPTAEPAPEIIPELAAEEQSGSSTGGATVTLTGTSAAGSIAANATKSFMIYLPTYTPEEGKLALRVKVKAIDNGCLVSYTRTVRLDALLRSTIYTNSFSLVPAIRKVEFFLYNVGTSAAPKYITCADMNTNASATELTPGTAVTYANSSSVSSTLSSSEWSTFQSNYFKGLTKIDGHWGLLYSVASITFKSSYTAAEWETLKSQGVVFLPVLVNNNGEPQETRYFASNSYYIKYKFTNKGGGGVWHLDGQPAVVNDNINGATGLTRTVTTNTL